MRRCLLQNAVLALLLLAGPVAHAIEDRADIEPNELARPGGGIAWKLTPGVYRETAGRAATDLNLRGNLENHTFWIGSYQRGAEFAQWRAGYERQFAVPLGRVIASGQLASRGFLGSSITFEAIGAKLHPAAASWVGLFGWGRTNKRPYYNLNFDPNDSVLIGAGWRPAEATALTLFQVRDDRLGTGQRVTHLVLRQQTGAKSRWTIDLFERSGRADADPETPKFRATGLSITYDWEPWFARISRDPKVNYSDSDMTRLSIGMRF